MRKRYLKRFLDVTGDDLYVDVGAGGVRLEVFDSTNESDSVAKLDDETAIAVATTLLRAVQLRKKMNKGENQ